MQQIKGSVLKSRLAFIEQHAGADGARRVLESLGDDDRKVLRMIMPVQWYPFELGRRLDDAIVKTVGGGRSDFFERLGAASAAQNLATLHKGFLTPGRPHDFLGKSPQIYRLYYETGRREYLQTGEKSGTITTHDAEAFSAPDCLTVIGWHRKALEMQGVSGVHVVHDECRAKGGAVCRYLFTWS